MVDTVFQNLIEKLTTKIEELKEIKHLIKISMQRNNLLIHNVKSFAAKVKTP